MEGLVHLGLEEQASSAAIDAQESVVGLVKNTPMLENLQILSLGQKHLVRILARSKRIRVGAGIHLSHLLGHLTRRILIAQNENEDTLQAEQTQKVPRQTAHPSDIEVPGHDAGLEHALEAYGERERQFQDDKAREEGVDPRHD